MTKAEIKGESDGVDAAVSLWDSTPTSLRNRVAEKSNAEVDKTVGRIIDGQIRRMRPKMGQTWSPSADPYMLAFARGARVALFRVVNEWRSGPPKSGGVYATVVR